MQEYRMLSTSGILGYGYAEESLKIGMSWDPHVIGCDGGSTDPGPYYLGAGKSFCSRLSVKRDLRLMLQAATAAGIPCIVGTAGGAEVDGTKGKVLTTSVAQIFEDFKRAVSAFHGIE